MVQGEGAPSDSVGSHYQKFVAVREEYQRLLQKNPAFVPAFPAATNPVLRRPPRPEGRVWLENVEAIAVVDLANAAYGLMLRLLAYSYALAGPSGGEVAQRGLAICLDGVRWCRWRSALRGCLLGLPTRIVMPGCPLPALRGYRGVSPLGARRGGILSSGLAACPGWESLRVLW